MSPTWAHGRENHIAVDDHGLEAIRKSAEEITPGDKSDYQLKVRMTNVSDITSLIDGVESLLTTIRDNADQLEGFTDGLEGLLTSILSATDDLESFTDQLEGYLDDVEARLGAINESAPATDIDDSGLNGRLKRVAQNLTILQSQYATGTLESVNDAVTLSFVSCSSATIEILNMDPGDISAIVFQSSVDGINWDFINGASVTAYDGELYFSPTQGNGRYAFVVSGCKQIRAFALGGPLASTVTVNIGASASSSIIHQILGYTFVKQASGHRFETNPISGQTGIAGGPGQATANTTRVVLPSENYSAFGFLRVAAPESIFDCSFQWDAQPLLWDTSTSTGGTVAHNSNKASVDLTTTTTSGSEAIFQTRQYFKYHPGKGQYVVFTGVIGNPKTNTRKRVGQFTANNGFFLEVDDTTAYAVVRSSTSGSPVDTKVAQADWNLDKLDGTGASGVSISFDNQNILFVDYQWLGSGIVRFGTVINGRTIYAHQFNFSNTLTVPYSRTATLPLRLELTNTGTAASSTTTHLTCCAVYSEGGFTPEGIIRASGTGIAGKSIGATGKIPLLSIRKASANAQIPVKMVNADVFINTNDEQLFELWINTTLTGATWAITEGKCQLDVAATAITGGTRIHSFFAANTGSGFSIRSLEEIFRSTNTILGVSIAGVSDILTLTSENISGGSSTGFASFTFRELT